MVDREGIIEETTENPQPAYRPEMRKEHVRLECLYPNPWQPRTALSQEHIRELADSIAQVGVLQRPLVRRVTADIVSDSPDVHGPDRPGKFEIAFGHARVEAVRLLQQRGQWPWPTLEVDVRPLSDEEMATIALSENTKRKDLAPIEMYRAWKRALEIQGLTQEKLAGILGIARPTLSNALRVLALPQIVLDRVDSGELSIHGARECLCLQADDHAHVDIMEQVIAEIAGTGLGVAPDWRVANVRRLIRDKVTSRLTSEWRHLDTKQGYKGGVHSGYAAAFDVVAFQKAFPSCCHTIPNEGNRDPESGLLWTGETREWKKWQDRAKKTAQQVLPVVGESQIDKETRELLEHDPVARQLIARSVSRETVMQDVLGRMIIQAPAPDGDVLNKTNGYRLLHQHLAQAIQGLQPGTQVWKTLATIEEAEKLAGDLRLAEYGLTVPQIYKAIVAYLGNVQRDVTRELAARTKEALTPELKRELGSRGESILSLATTKVWHHSLHRGAYHGVPHYFPDLDECLKRCTIGARYASQHLQYSETEIVCTNAEHFDEKMEAGKAAFRQKVDLQQQQLSERHRPIVEALAMVLDPSAAYAVAIALLHGISRWPMIQPQGERDFAFEPPCIAWARGALGMPAMESQYDALDRNKMEDVLRKHPEHAPQAAAGLIVAMLGYSENGNELLNDVASRLGIAGPAETIQPKQKRKGKAADEGAG